jgi:alpha-L-fucosidase 2
LFDAHPPFQIDGNFGCTSGITEMLMQSADGTLHLLPAVPDVWQKEGTITGLKAIGGFEIISMQWKDSKLVKAVIKSNLGGNLRLRVPNAVALNGGSLKVSVGKNANPFYQVTETATPIISTKANIALLNLQPTMVYDVPTQVGKIYTFISK